MSLNSPIFNIHDIALVLVVFQSVLLACLLLTVREGKEQSNRLLALLIIAIGLDALDTLMYWSAPVKELLLQQNPTMFFSAKVALLVQGPLLFFYVKSVIYTNYNFRRRDFLHFAPAALYPAYAALTVVSLGDEGLHQGLQNYSVYWDNSFYRVLVLAQATVMLVYALLALRLIASYRNQLKQNFSNLDKIERNWLRLLILGFSGICFWNLSVHLLGMVYSRDISSMLGLGGNYLDFLFINLLVFYNLLHSNVAQGLKDPAGLPGFSELPRANPTDSAEETVVEDSRANDEREEFSPAQIQAIERAIHEERAYLLHDLTLDQLAHLAHLPSRVTSNIINRHFGMSFFDFINNLRVDTAKALLLSAPEKTVLEIAEMAGFNSKSAFNRFFRKFAGMTPTEFRKGARHTDA